MYPTMQELFHDWSEHRPEGKLELIEGKLIVGNSLVGSRLMLRQILQGWKADAAVAFASPEMWVEALKAGFGLSASAQSEDVQAYLEALESAGVDYLYQPEDLIAGQGVANTLFHPHHGVLQSLSTGLFAIAEDVGGRSLSRDFVMRLGDNGFTPDVLFYKSRGLNQLCSWYLDGPAELVIEVLLPGHKYCDRIVKRDYYRCAGVPEYWIVNPGERQVEFWRLVAGDYQRQMPDEDGRYRPISVPGLAFQSEPLWDEDLWYGGGQQDLFVLEAEPQPFKKIESIEREEWGSLSFAPQLQLESTPIRFEEYISWCPRAKFEFYNGKLHINSRKGTQHVLGLLLITFGLASAVKVLPPQAWVQALKQRVALEQQDAQRKAEWWQLARRAATILREQFGIQRIAVIGEPATPQPLNYWSEIKLVVWDVERQSSWDIYKAISPISDEPRIQVIDAERDYLTVDDREEIERAIAIW